MEKANNKGRGRWKLLAVLAVCAAPLIASYFTYYVIKPKGGVTNYGALIDPRQYPIPAMASTTLDGKPAPVIDGFTGEQRFFMGWAQAWRTLWRDEALRQQLVNGTHSPGHIRAYAPLRNMDAWYDAFDVTAADPLWVAPEDRVRIW